MRRSPARASQTLLTPSDPTSTGAATSSSSSFLAELARSRAQLLYEGHTGEVCAMAAHPFLPIIASAQSPDTNTACGSSGGGGAPPGEVASSSDAVVHIWDTRTGRPVAPPLCLVDSAAAVVALAFTGDGRYLLALTTLAVYTGVDPQLSDGATSGIAATPPPVQSPPQMRQRIVCWDIPSLPPPPSPSSGRPPSRRIVIGSSASTTTDDDEDEEEEGEAAALHRHVTPACSILLSLPTQLQGGGPPSSASDNGNEVFESLVTRAHAPRGTTELEAAVGDAGNGREGAAALLVGRSSVHAIHVVEGADQAAAGTSFILTSIPLPPASSFCEDGVTSAGDENAASPFVSTAALWGDTVIVGYTTGHIAAVGVPSSSSTHGTTALSASVVIQPRPSAATSVCSITALSICSGSSSSSESGSCATPIVVLYGDGAVVLVRHIRGSDVSTDSVNKDSTACGDNHMVLLGAVPPSPSRRTAEQAASKLPAAEYTPALAAVLIPASCSITAGSEEGEEEGEEGAAVLHMWVGGDYLLSHTVLRDVHHTLTPLPSQPISLVSPISKSHRYDARSAVTVALESCSGAGCFSDSGGGTCVAAHPTLPLYAVGDTSGRVTLWDAVSSTQLTSTVVVGSPSSSANSDSAITALDFSPDGVFIVAAYGPLSAIIATGANSGNRSSIIGAEGVRLRQLAPQQLPERGGKGDNRTVKGRSSLSSNATSSQPVSSDAVGSTNSASACGLAVLSFCLSERSYLTPLSSVASSLAAAVAAYRTAAAVSLAVILCSNGGSSPHSGKGATGWEATGSASTTVASLSSMGRAQRDSAMAGEAWRPARMDVVHLLPRAHAPTSTSSTATSIAHINAVRFAPTGTPPGGASASASSAAGGAGGSSMSAAANPRGGSSVASASPATGGGGGGRGGSGSSSVGAATPSRLLQPASTRPPSSRDSVSSASATSSAAHAPVAVLAPSLTFAVAVSDGTVELYTLDVSAAPFLANSAGSRLLASTTRGAASSSSSSCAAAAASSSACTPATLRRRRTLKAGTATAAILSLDWDVSGRYIQSATAAYALVHWEAHSGAVVRHPSVLRDVAWATSSSPLGWSVRGVWDDAQGDLVAAAAAVGNGRGKSRRVTLSSSSSSAAPSRRAGVGAADGSARQPLASSHGDAPASMARRSSVLPPTAPAPPTRRATPTAPFSDVTAITRSVLHGDVLVVGCSDGRLKVAGFPAASAAAAACISSTSHPSPIIDVKVLAGDCGVVSLSSSGVLCEWGLCGVAAGLGEGEGEDGVDELTELRAGGGAASTPPTHSISQLWAQYAPPTSPASTSSATPASVGTSAAAATVQRLRHAIAASAAAVGMEADRALVSDRLLKALGGFSGSPHSARGGGVGRRKTSGVRGGGGAATASPTPQQSRRSLSTPTASLFATPSSTKGSGSVHGLSSATLLPAAATSVASRSDSEEGEEEEEDALTGSDSGGEKPSGGNPVMSSRNLLQPPPQPRSRRRLVAARTATRRRIGAAVPLKELAAGSTSPSSASSTGSSSPG